jgi:hypothetical protein
MCIVYMWYLIELSKALLDKVYYYSQLTDERMKVHSSKGRVTWPKSEL